MDAGEREEEDIRVRNLPVTTALPWKVPGKKMWRFFLSGCASSQAMLAVRLASGIDMSLSAKTKRPGIWHGVGHGRERREASKEGSASRRRHIANRPRSLHNRSLPGPGGLVSGDNSLPSAVS